MKKVTLFGRDFSKLERPKKDNGEPVDWDDDEQEALKRILQEKTLSYSAFINMSQVRKGEYEGENEDEKKRLLWEQPGVKTGQELKWNGIVGQLRLRYQFREEDYDVTVKLGSRFDQDKHDYFLRSMILSWLLGDGVELTAEQLGASWDELFRSLWVSIFKSHLIRANRTGTYKTYQYFEDNAHRIRGQIDIPRHIRLNMGLNNGKIASKYRENTVDNYLNHLIIHTYQELKKRFPMLVDRVIDGDMEARLIIRKLMAEAPSYIRNDVRTLSARLQNPIAHPFYIWHEELRKVCLRILANTGAPVFCEPETSDVEAETMLFYVPDLWEAYIEHCIIPRIGIKDVGMDTQAETKNFGGIVNMRPDFVLDHVKNGKSIERIVLDAKYKPGWRYFSETQTIVHKQMKADICQCLLYKELFQAKYTGTIFPVHTESNCYRKRKISRFDTRESFHAIGVRIPTVGDKETYEDWAEKLDRNAAAAAQYIAKLFDTENRP